MKRYRIICITDPYHASRSASHKGKEILKYNGATPVEWVHDDYFGLGYTLEEARKELDGYAAKDWESNGGKNLHKHFAMSYTSDIWTYRIEEFIPKK